MNFIDVIEKHYNIRSKISSTFLQFIRPLFALSDLVKTRIKFHLNDSNFDFSEKVTKKLTTGNNLNFQSFLMIF